VVELENSIFGPCVLDVGLTVNGEELESFPRVIPDGFFVERDVANDLLRQRLRGSERWEGKEMSSMTSSEKADLSVSALEDAICARRIFQFVLE
jgi:hypothetical protein